MDKPPSSDTSYGPGRDLHVVQVVGAEDDLIPFDNDVLGESSYCEMLVPPMMAIPALCADELELRSRSECDLPQFGRVGIALPAARRDQKDAFVEKGIGSVRGGNNCP